ncbi:polyprenol monophosphomannose synthase [Compostimonas suwonensis]|uniref:polyprenol monophosphomannose synthase n=1 Tax=Compostimonas suwonensis TaxID=1048394 RepID=UPI000C24A501|nr:polyprenol monophosphomannose synthase [Compostimonas suwonensis]
MTNPSPKVVVVVPTYNERDNLPKLVQALEALRMPALHLLVVDDNSPDGTGDVADQLVNDSAIPISVLHRLEKDGLGRAYVAGISRALADGADIVVQMDADLSHPADVIPAFIHTLTTTDAAVVLGSRYVAGGSVADDWAWHRKALSAGANFYVNAILRLRVKDATAGFKAWHAATLTEIDVLSIQSNGYAFQVEMNYRTVRRGMRIVEVPIRFEERTEGASKMSLGVQLESALMPWKLLLKRAELGGASQNAARGVRMER